MEDGLVVKTNLLQILEKQLAARAKKRQSGIVALGSATDAYIQQEEQWKLTAGILELLLQYRFPVFISTKCTLIKRDTGILQQIDQQAILPDDLRDKLKRGVILSVSLSTMDEKISSTLEPGVATPMQRMELVKELKAAGFLVGVNAIPLLPFISDTEESMDNIFAATKAVA